MDKNLNRSEIPCDTIVLAVGVKPRKEVVRMFEGCAPEIYVAGDCNKERGNLYSATVTRILRSDGDLSKEGESFTGEVLP
jgi:NAD(P)H-nitrite reductase large subunit